MAYRAYPAGVARIIAWSAAFAILPSSSVLAAPLNLNIATDLPGNQAIQLIQVAPTAGATRHSQPKAPSENTGVR